MKKNDLLFITALILSIWFLLTGIFWVYWTALFVAYPAAIVAFILWRIIKKDGRSRNIAIPVILFTGALISLGMLTVIIIHN